MDFSDDMTLAEARDILRELVWTGHTCPLCARHAQVYRWSLYDTAAKALILYYRLGNEGTAYVDIEQLKKAGHRGQGDASRLKHWGLLEEEKSRREDGGRSGWWRCTAHGRAFVRGEATIPKYAYIYANRCLRRDGEQLDISAVLGEKFDYSKLMASTT